MNIQKTLGLTLLLAAYAMLYPGLTQPMLTVTGTVEKMKLVALGKQFIEETPTKLGLVGDMAKMMLDNLEVEGTVSAFDKTRSILGTARDLHESNNTLVAVLILFFSVIVPLLKGLITLAAMLPFWQKAGGVMRWISSNMSKWSMADVFVIAIFLAYLAAKGIKEDTGLVSFDASLGTGFYFFLGYCLLSIVSAQVLYFKSAGLTFSAKESTSAKTAPKNKTKKKQARKNQGV